MIQVCSRESSQAKAPGRYKTPATREDTDAGVAGRTEHGPPSEAVSLLAVSFLQICARAPRERGPDSKGSPASRRVDTRQIGERFRGECQEKSEIITH